MSARARQLSFGLLLLLWTAPTLGCAEKSVHAELLVPASPERIWVVLTDASGYAEWNPIFVSAEGEFREGGAVTYQLKSPDGDLSEVEPDIRALIEHRKINQFGGIPGILTFDHTWKIEPVAEGSMVTQHEDYRGVYVWFWDPSWVEEQYEAGLVALRDRVSRSAGGER